MEKHQKVQYIKRRVRSVRDFQAVLGDIGEVVGVLHEHVNVYIDRLKRTELFNEDELVVYTTDEPPYKAYRVAVTELYTRNVDVISTSLEEAASIASDKFSMMNETPLLEDYVAQHTIEVFPANDGENESLLLKEM